MASLTSKDLVKQMDHNTKLVFYETDVFTCCEMGRKECRGQKVYKRSFTTTDRTVEICVNLVALLELVTFFQGVIVRAVVLN